MDKHGPTPSLVCRRGHTRRAIGKPCLVCRRESRRTGTNAWETRRQRYGPRGGNRPPPLKECCRWGHRLTEDNVYWKRNKRGVLVRQCKACVRWYEKHISQIKRRIQRRAQRKEPVPYTVRAQRAWITRRANIAARQARVEAPRAIDLSVMRRCSLTVGKMLFNVVR